MVLSGISSNGATIYDDIVVMELWVGLAAVLEEQIGCYVLGSPTKHWRALCRRPDVLYSWSRILLGANQAPAGMLRTVLWDCRIGAKTARCWYSVGGYRKCCKWWSEGFTPSHEKQVRRKGNCVVAQLRNECWNRLAPIRELFEKEGPSWSMDLNGS